MIGRIGLLVLALTAASPVVRASVCDELAAFARKLPDKTWTAGDKALAPVLTFDETRSTGMKPPQVSALEASLARRRDVRDAIGAGEDDAIFVDHLAGTDLYALSTIQGTMDCQTAVLVRAALRRPARIIDAPRGVKLDDTELCFRTSEGIGRAFGQPVHAVHDMIGPTTEMGTFTLSPWTGDGWGKTCTLELTFRARYALIERRCGDESLCADAEKRARELALAYSRFEENSSGDSTFTNGSGSPIDLKKRVKDYLASDNPDTWTPDFPAFSGKTVEDRPFSYGGFAMVPVTLAGRAYAVGIGHEGVGWRQGENTLVAFYTLENGVLTPKAGYVVERSLAALTEAKAR